MNEQERALLQQALEDAPPNGFERQWVRCRTCGQIACYHFQPYSLSSLMRVTPCGHGIGERDMGADCISEDDVREALAQPAQQELVDSMGMPLSCGKPLCSPGDHHPLCKLAEQPAQEVDWEKLYRLEVRRKESLAAKYERDTGRQLTRIVPMTQPAQEPECACPCCMQGIEAPHEYHLERRRPRPQVPQPAQEPVATVIEHVGFVDAIVRFDGVENMEQLSVGTKLYTTPPQRQPLTRKQLADAWISTDHITHATDRQIAYARAIENLHGIKENT